MNISCSCFVLNWFPLCWHLIYSAHKSIKTKLSNFTQVTSSIIIKNPLKPLKPIKTHLNPLKPTHPPDFLKNQGFGPTLLTRVDIIYMCWCEQLIILSLFWFKQRLSIQPLPGQIDTLLELLTRYNSYIWVHVL